MRRLALLAVAAVALAGCGGAAKKPADPGRDILGAFIAAAARDDTNAMREQLSPQSRKRTRPVDLAILVGTLRPMADRYRIVVSERITDTFGLAAAVRRPLAFAAPLRKVGDGWKLEVGGPIRIEPTGPLPGRQHQPVAQIAAEISGITGSGDALLYLDGQTLFDTKIYRAKTTATVFANLTEPVKPGFHSVVAFLNTSTEATARAWTFVVPRGR